jgi:hypothetical protein
MVRRARMPRTRGQPLSIQIVGDVTCRWQRDGARTTEQGQFSARTGEYSGRNLGAHLAYAAPKNSEVLSI